MLHNFTMSALQNFEDSSNAAREHLRAYAKFSLAVWRGARPRSIMMWSQGIAITRQADEVSRLEAMRGIDAGGKGKHSRLRR